MQLIFITFVTEKIFYFKTKCFHDIAKHSGENRCQVLHLDHENVKFLFIA